MLPNVSRGHSFAGVTAYLTHDKREDFADGTTRTADTEERVGFCRLMNFDDGEARTPAEAAKVMALTVRDADRIKQDAGVKATGNKAERETVFHMSLSWAKSEQVDEAEMVRAMGESLAAVGLKLDKGYQTYCIEHTDTEHQHLHVVVNLVHPLTGKQANPHRDQPKLQAWARVYEKQRGQVFCHDREAKYAAIDRKRGSHASPRRAAFNGKGQGETGKPGTGRAGGERAARDRPGRSVPYHVWKAQQQARNAAEQAAASQVKAALGGRYRDMQTRHEAAYQTRRQEQSQARADAQGGRNAIYEKYASALDAIYHPPAGPKQLTPERSLSVAVHQHLATRRTEFDRREGSAWGRFQNARTLAAGASLFRLVRLAMNPAERRRLFERQQRTTQKSLAPRGTGAPRERPQAKTADLPHRRAAAVKAMRTAELAAHAGRQAAGVASMAARHEFQQEAEQRQREHFKAESKAAWQAHREAFAPEVKAKEQDNGRTAAPGSRTAGPRPAAAAQAEKTASAEAAAPKPERNADRFGRSRDRKPRQPRTGRDQGGRQTQGDRQGDTDRQAPAKGTTEAENRPVDAVEAFNRATTPAGVTPAQEQASGQEQGGSQPSDQDEIAHIMAERAARLAREAEAGRDLDPGREMSR